MGHGGGTGLWFLVGRWIQHSSEWTGLRAGHVLYIYNLIMGGIHSSTLVLYFRDSLIAVFYFINNHKKTNCDLILPLPLLLILICAYSFYINNTIYLFLCIMSIATLCTGTFNQRHAILYDQLRIEDGMERIYKPWTAVASYSATSARRRAIGDRMTVAWTPADGESPGKLRYIYII